MTRQPKDGTDAPTKAITWLHLSDLHHGQTGEGGRWPQYRERVLADMKELARKEGPPDLILFTGDLSCSGKAEEFARVTSTLNEIRAAVGGDPVVVPVPGNHDLIRPRSAHGTFHYYLSQVAMRQGFLKHSEEFLGYQEERFAGYLEWWKREIRSDWSSRRFSSKPGLLPGDFCLTVDCHGLRLGLLGINSAWLHLHGEIRERDLAVEIEQFSNAGIDLPRWAEAHHACLILMHHPPSWLEGQRERDFRTDIYAPDRFVACLFGHMHEQQSMEETADRQRRLWFQASSLFGLEHYGQAGKEHRICGYDWGRLQRIAPSRGILTRWKRRVDRAGGDRIIVAPPFGEPEREDYEVVLRADPHGSPDRMAWFAIPSPKQAWKGVAIGEARHILEEAKQRLEAGHLREARAAAQAPIERWEQMAEPGHDEDHARVLTQLRLFEATCSLCLQDSPATRARVRAIDETLLDVDGRLHLAQLLAQIGETARAREVIADLDHSVAHATRQLIEVEEGTIPKHLADEPMLRLRAAMRAVELGQHDQAARWALAVYETASDQPLTRAAVVAALLMALDASVLEVPSGCTPVALELRSRIIELLQAHLEPRQPSPISGVVVEKQLASWSARFHQLSYDYVRLRTARAWLEELGGDTAPFQPWMPGEDTRTFPEALEGAPPWHAHYNEAMQHTLQNQHEDALRVLNQAIAQFPGGMPLLYEAAELSEILGKTEQALAHAEQAFQLLPGHGQAILLARLRLASGQAQAVWNELRTHLQGSPGVVARRILATAAMQVAPAEAPRCWNEVMALPDATASDRIALAMSRYVQHDVPGAAELAWETFEQGEQALASDDLWRCTLLQIHDASPGAQDRVMRLARTLLGRFQDSADDAAGGWYLALRSYLGKPPSLPLPDMQRLEQAGSVVSLPQDEALTLLRLRSALEQHVLELYLRGEAPLESVAATLQVPESSIVEWLIRERLPLSTPLDLAEHQDNVENKRVLLGFVELLVLDELDLLASFARALGGDGRIVLFRDVAERIDEAASKHLLRERPYELDRLYLLRAYLQRHWPAEARERDDSEWLKEQRAVPVRVHARGDGELALAAFLRALVAGKHLEKSRADQLLEYLEVPRQEAQAMAELPERMALDAAALTMLSKSNLLEDVHAALAQGLRILPGAWKHLEQTIARHELERDARRRADRVHNWLASMRRREQVSPPIDRPTVDLPPARDDHPEELRAWLVQAAGWGEALVKDPELDLLSADALASELFTAAAPASLLRGLQWRKESGFFHHYDRLAPHEKRKLSFAAVVRRLAGERKDDVVRRLHALGFTNAYGPDELLVLADELGGLSHARAARILDDIEAPSDIGASWQFARLALARLYARVIWSAWCQRKTPHAADVTDTLIERIADIDRESSESLLVALFRFLWVHALEDVQASFAPVTGAPGTVDISLDAPAGQLWRWLDAWMGVDAHRRYLVSHAAIAVLTQNRIESLVDKSAVRIAPFFLAIEALESAPGHGGQHYGTLRNGLEILSATWQGRPLEKLKITFGHDGQSPHEISDEELLRQAVQQLDFDKPIKHDGIGCTLPVHLAGTTYDVPGLMPAALLLRAPGNARAKLAASLAALEGPDDGRVVASLLAIAAQPDDQEAMREYALRATEAPWRQVRLDPLAVRLWGKTLTSSFPATIEDLRALLSEPEPLPEEGELEEILRARLAQGPWGYRPDALHLLERTGEILGHPAWPFAWLEQERTLAEQVDAAFARLRRAADQPAARVAFDLLLCCAGGSLQDDEPYPERVTETVEHVLTSAMQPPPDSLAAHEAALLCTAARVVWNLGGGRETPRNRLWLTWCLYQWLIRQIEALPEEQQRGHVRTLASAWLDTNLPEEPDLLDPSRFGPDRLDHRLLAILHVLGGLKPEALQAIVTPAVEEILEALSQREPTPEERAVEALPAPGSSLGWHEKTPRTVPALAAIVLELLRAPEPSW